MVALSSANPASRRVIHAVTDFISRCPGEIVRCPNRFRIRLGGPGLLTLIEKYIGLIHDVADREAARGVLAVLAKGFSFRSAFLLEFSEDRRIIAESALDTDPARQAAGSEMARRDGGRLLIELLARTEERGTTLRIKPEELEADGLNESFRARFDLLELTGVPIALEDGVAGLVGFSGTPELSPMQKRALHVLSYSLFARIRAITAAKTPLATMSPHLKPLTPREKEVMRLSAIGRTSAEIARELGLSPRTVNQHVENVAEKLGTKNRTHTIAELMRHHMLA